VCHRKADYHSDRTESTPKFDTRHGFGITTATPATAMLDSQLLNRIRADTEITGPSQGTQFERAQQHFDRYPE
jgi:hypothetical protein